MVKLVPDLHPFLDIWLRRLDTKIKLAKEIYGATSYESGLIVKKRPRRFDFSSFINPERSLQTLARQDSPVFYMMEKFYQSVLEDKESNKKSIPYRPVAFNNKIIRDIHGFIDHLMVKNSPDAPRVFMNDLEQYVPANSGSFLAEAQISAAYFTILKFENSPTQLWPPKDFLQGEKSLPISLLVLNHYVLQKYREHERTRIESNSEKRMPSIQRQPSNQGRTNPPGTNAEN